MQSPEPTVAPPADDMPETTCRMGQQGRLAGGSVVMYEGRRRRIRGFGHRVDVTIDGRAEGGRDGMPETTCYGRVSMLSYYEIASRNPLWLKRLVVSGIPSNHPLPFVKKDDRKLISIPDECRGTIHGDKFNGDRPPRQSVRGR